jgi:hypothetical protein
MTGPPKVVAPFGGAVEDAGIGEVRGKEPDGRTGV